jgi:putative hydrolase of the HAD superfamily
MVQTLDELAPGHGIRIEDVRPHISAGFPWHTPEVAHPQLTPSEWWTAVEAIIFRAYTQVGLDEALALQLSHAFRQRYVDPRFFRLYDDTLPAMGKLAELGWHHVILSNHVPELPDIVTALGLGGLLAACLSSANIGYEKPSKRAYEIALESAGYPESVWMVGDSVTADVKGAEAVGIPAILVRNARSKGECEHSADDLAGVVEMVLEQKPSSSEVLQT